MIRLYLKKILVHKIRLMLMIVNFSLGLLLALIILTIGINISSDLKSINNKPLYYNMFISKNNITNNIEYDNSYKKCNIRESQVKIHTIDDISIELNIYEISINSDDSIINDYIINGDGITNDDSIIVSNKIVSKLCLNNVIGERIMLSNNKEYIITGIFENDVYTSYTCIIKSDEFFESDDFIIKADNISDLISLSSLYKNSGYLVYDYIDELNSLNSYYWIISIIFSVMSLLTLIATFSILYSSLKSSIQDKYKYFAMIKAFGYTNKTTNVFISIELFLIYIFSIFISLISYIAILKLNNFNFDLSKYFSDIASNNLLRINGISITVVWIYSLVLTIFVGIKASRLINNCNVIKVLTEVE